MKKYKSEMTVWIKLHSESWNIGYCLNSRDQLPFHYTMNLLVLALGKKLTSLWHILVTTRLPPTPILMYYLINSCKQRTVLLILMYLPVNKEICDFSKWSCVWITINCGKFWKTWEYQTTWPASWETYIQVRKQQLELTWNNRLVPNRKKSTSRPYIVTVFI